MHPNPVFHTQEATRNLDYAKKRGFGVLAVDGPLLSHIPFLLGEEDVRLHLVRSNPIARALREGPLAARIAVSGPDGYISPDWYETNDQVPTWNYIAIHLRGTLTRLPQDDIHAMLDHQSAHFEDQLSKQPWTTDKMTPAVLGKMMRQIVPCRMTVTQIDGTWKLNQNKPDDVRLRAADNVETSTIGSDTQTLAHLMRHPDT